MYFTKVFVYGTLMTKMKAHSIMENSLLLGKNVKVPGFIMYDIGPYPAIVEGEGTIIGEVYLISRDTLYALDHYEEIDSGLYTRKEVQTPFGRAYIYVYNKQLTGYNTISLEEQPYNKYILNKKMTY